MAIATCWLSATARMAMPIRLFRKNQVKMARNSKVTMTPSTWIGGREMRPKEIGVSPIGSDSARVSPPTVIGGRPRSMAPRPIVAMMTAITGRPSSGRSTMRSSPKPKATITATVMATAAITGMPLAASASAATKPASITNSPWAKLMASVAL